MFKYEMRAVQVKLSEKGVKAYQDFYLNNYGFKLRVGRRVLMSITKLTLILRNDWSLFEVTDWNPKRYA